MIAASENYSVKCVFEKRFAGFWCTNEAIMRKNITWHVVDSEARKWTVETGCCRVWKIPVTRLKTKTITHKNSIGRSKFEAINRRLWDLAHKTASQFN